MLLRVFVCVCVCACVCMCACVQVCVLDKAALIQKQILKKKKGTDFAEWFWLNVSLEARSVNWGLSPVD